MDFNQRRVLGRTGLSVGRLGIGSSYGAPPEAYEKAFEKGVTIFTVEPSVRNLWLKPYAIFSKKVSETSSSP